MRSLSLFVRTGLQRGHSVALVCEIDDHKTLVEHLTVHEIDVDAAQHSGQLKWLDSRATLDAIMHKPTGMPDWLRFRSIIGGVFEGLHRSARPAVRAYGDMVNLLWHSGQANAAIRLEEYWNELARIYPFALFCGYMSDPRDLDGYASPLSEIARTHDGIVASDEDERWRVALESGCRDVFGTTFAEMESLARREEQPGEAQLPAAHRTMLWIMRKRPIGGAAVLERARAHMAAAAAGD